MNRVRPAKTRGAKDLYPKGLLQPMWIALVGRPSNPRSEEEPWDSSIATMTSQGLCTGKAYDNQDTRELVNAYRFTPLIHRLSRSRGEEVKDKLCLPGRRARRWVAEACHAWLNRNRAVLMRWSKKDENHLAFLMLACGLVAFRKARAFLEMARVEAADGAGRVPEAGAGAAEGVGDHFESVVLADEAESVGQTNTSYPGPIDFRWGDYFVAVKSPVNSQT